MIYTLYVPACWANISNMYSTYMCFGLCSQHKATHTHIHRPVSISISRAESERNPWVVLTSAILTRCQGPEVKLDLGQQVVAMVRSLYNTKHKLPVQVIR